MDMLFSSLTPKVASKILRSFHKLALRTHQPHRAVLQKSFCPEEMERWGVASIFKESGRLLHKHYRLFLPFLLAFYVPISILTVYETSFLSPSFSPLLDASVVNSAQTTDPPGNQSFTKIFSWTLFFSICVVGTFSTGAESYIAAYSYTLYHYHTHTNDDRSIIPKVFKPPLHVPVHVFLRMLILELCIDLAFLLLCLLSVIIGGILQAIILATAGWSDPKFFFLFGIFPVLAGIIFLAIVFALALVTAVLVYMLESGNYGGEAMKRSAKLARIGRAVTIAAVALTTAIVLPAVLTVPKRGIESSGMPVWAKVVLLIVLEVLDSVVKLYFGLVSLLIYFIYKARFDAAGSAGIPISKRIIRHNDPIVEGKGSVTYIGELRSNFNILRKLRS